ncbi:MAG TPA: hypothetical protein VFT16_00550 [Candidatus Saccharimonadales bacterium]|nr:hypothetical protein [Candidatus Saccharimonadales bacterium]
MAERFPHLLDVRALRGPKLLAPLLSPGSRAVAETLNARATQIADAQIEEVPAAVIIHGQPSQYTSGRRRENDTLRAERILDTVRNVRAQEYSGSLVVAATVDESFHPLGRQLTQLVRHDVHLLRQDPDFSHPEAINAAVQELATDDGVTVAIAAGNRFATDQALRTASSHVGRGAWGVFGPLVIDRNPSKVGYAILNGNSEYYKQEAEPDGFPTANENGFMPDAGAAFYTQALRDNPLDAAYPRGGSYRAWGDSLQRQAGDIWYDPGMAIHDSRAFGMHLGTLLEESLLHRDDQ